MADFLASLIDPVSLEPDLVLVCSTELLTITDNSNYDTNAEEGHARADFTNFRKIIIENAQTTLFTFSSTGDGDVTMTAASSSLDSVVFTLNNDDDVYQVTLYTVPTWFATDNYQSSDDFVYRPTVGKLFKCLVTNLNKIPEDNPTEWLEVVQTDLTTKYCQIELTTTICNLNDCIDDLSIAGSCAVTELNCDQITLLENRSYFNANKLSAIRRAVQVQAGKGQKERARQGLNLTKTICSCAKAECGC